MSAGDPVRQTTDAPKPCRYPDCRCMGRDDEGTCKATGSAIDALHDRGKPWSGINHDPRP